MNLDQAITSVEACADQESLNSKLQTIIAGYGFFAYCFLDIGQPGARNFYYNGTTGEKWETDYVSNGFYEVDEVIKKARRTNRPFTWGQISLPPKLGVRKSGALKAFEAAADHRYTEGLVIPLHFVDTLGRMHSALCSLIWSESRTRFAAIDTRTRQDLHLILVYWMQSSIDIRETDKRSTNNVEIFSSRANGGEIRLTDRERDVISWAARGKTLLDTADILAISAETVETHVKNAIVKLQAGNKTHAVAKAIHLGLIDI